MADAADQTIQTGAAVAESQIAELDAKLLPVGWLLSLAVGTIAIMSSLVSRWHKPKRGEPLPQHNYAWHGCLVDSCGKLVRPREGMCIEHWCMVPVPLRMEIMRLKPLTERESCDSDQQRVALIGRAIMFVESEETQRSNLLRRLRTPATETLLARLRGSW